MILILFSLLARETKGRTLEEIGAVFGDELVVQTLDEQVEAEKLEVQTAVHIEGKV